MPSPVNALEYTPSGDIDQYTHTITKAVAPRWAPNALAAGSVTGAGDLALIDGTSTTGGVAVSMYITNLAGVDEDYASFVLPVKIYSSLCTAGRCDWTEVPEVVTTAPTYITSTNGVISFNVPAGKYYDVTIATGGSYYCTSVSTIAPATLTPTFYFTAQSIPSWPGLSTLRAANP